MTLAKKTFDVVLALVLMGGGAAAQTADEPQDMPQSDEEQLEQAESKPAEVMATRLNKIATVNKVNKQDRELMLKDRQGQMFKVNVPESVTGFETIKKGDKIAVDYYSAIALTVEPSDDGATEQTSQTTVDRVAGPLPGGIVADQVNETVQVVKLDKKKHLLTIKRPGGERDVIDVSDTEMQSAVGDLEKGDKIRASYAEAVAVSIEPQKKAKPRQARR